MKSIQCLLLDIKSMIFYHFKQFLGGYQPGGAESIKIYQRKIEDGVEEKLSSLRLENEKKRIIFIVSFHCSSRICWADVMDDFLFFSSFTILIVLIKNGDCSFQEKAILHNVNISNQITEKFRNKIFSEIDQSNSSLTYYHLSTIFPELEKAASDEVCYRMAPHCSEFYSISFCIFRSSIQPKWATNRLRTDFVKNSNEISWNFNPCWASHWNHTIFVCCITAIKCKLHSVKANLSVQLISRNIIKI